MAYRSAIEWTDASWNPVTGCTEVSAGCDHCYARVFAERFRGVPEHPYEQGFDLRLWPDRLALPLRWKKPRRIFVNSMSDLFHVQIPDEYIDQVFSVMATADHHVFQILTKRPQRLARIAARYDWPAHIWIGVSIESNDVAWRADYLRKVPSAVRFVSAEPLLGPIDRLSLVGIDWLITGGESGNGARWCDPEWVREVRDRCNQSQVAFFHKQWGGRTSKAGGRLLDGREWNEMPTPVVRQKVD